MYIVSSPDYNKFATYMIIDYYKQEVKHVSLAGVTGFKKKIYIDIHIDVQTENTI